MLTVTVIETEHFYLVSEKLKQGVHLTKLFLVITCMKYQYLDISCYCSLNVTNVWQLHLHWTQFDLSAKC